VEEVIAGRYVLAGELGAGGMARVVRARDLVLDRWVAVKLLPTGTVDATSRERFRREARSSARFSHPNAVATFDAGDDAGQLYLVMELVDGPSLAQVLARDGPLAVDAAVRIADGVLAALDAAHAAGLVHRDVKPGNVLLGAGGQVKLADFGIARRLDDLAHDLTATGIVVGTPKYASPEQLAGRPATAATDLYATGVLLYEMLAGAPPYDGATPATVAAAHLSAPVPDVAAVRPDVPAAVAAAISRALAKDPAARFPSAAAMRSELASRTTPYPRPSPMPATVLSPSPSPSPSAAPPARRHSWWWVVTAAVVLVGVGLIVWVARQGDDGDPGTASVGSTSPPTATVAPTTTVATTVPTTTAAPTTTVATTPPQPTTVAGLLAAVAADPAMFGDHTREAAELLRRVDGRGNDDRKRARTLLDHADKWVEDGEADPAAVAVLRAVLEPIADSGDGEGGGD
jgi:eukaryotic-like serine/threonine-protein kinase